MPDVVLYNGGTADIKYIWDKNTPRTNSPPFGRTNEKDTPPFDAHFEAEMGGKATFAAGYPFIPHLLEWQRINVRAFKPVAGDVLQMIVVPVNHYVESVRLDVRVDDPLLAGATVAITGQWIREDPVDPTLFVATPSTEIDTAAAAQTGTGISLTVPSTNVVWLSKVGGSGYVEPLYVEPQYLPAPATAGARLYQGGGLVLGVKLTALPSAANVGLDMLPGGLYLTTRIDGYECPAFV
jgi:hypothetical protein